MRKKLLAVGLMLGAVAVGAAAWAYYTGSGSGSGSVAQGGSAPLALVVTVGDGSTPDIFPGDALPFSGQIANSSGHDAHIGGIALDTSYGDNGISVSGDPGCLSSWFSVSGVGFADSSLPASGIAPTGSGYGVKGTLNFLDEPVQQDACSGAIVSVGLTTTP